MQDSTDSLRAQIDELRKSFLPNNVELDKIMEAVEAEIRCRETEARQWHQYTGEYEKRFYDIKLWSGEVYENCWPNANTFHEGVIGKLIEGKDVCYIRAVPPTNRDGEEN